MTETLYEKVIVALAGGDGVERALHVDDHGRQAADAEVAEHLSHQRKPRTGRRRHGSCPAYRGTHYHVGRGDLALGLDKYLAFLRQTAGDIFQHLRLRSDGIAGEEVKPASYRGLAYCLIALCCYFLAHCAPHLKTLMALSGHIIPHSLQPMHLSGSACTQ